MKSHNGSTQWLKPYIYVITCNFTMVNEILDLLIHIILQFINRSKKQVGQQLASRARIQYTETKNRNSANIITYIQKPKPSKNAGKGEGQLDFLLERERQICFLSILPKKT